MKTTKTNMTENNNTKTGTMKGKIKIKTRSKDNKEILIKGDKIKKIETTNKETNEG